MKALCRDVGLPALSLPSGSRARHLDMLAEMSARNISAEQPAADGEEFYLEVFRRAMES